MVRLGLALVLLALGAGPAMGAVTASVQGTALTIAGDGADDTVGITSNLTTLQIDTNGDGVTDASFDQSTFDHTVIDLGAGNDRLTIGNSTASFGVFTIDGGPGNDVLLDGDGSDIVHGGDGDDLISGGRGDDQLFGDAGSDTFSWSPGDANDTIEGGDGDDRFVMNGGNVNEKFEISPNGPRIRMTRDVATVVQDLAGLETIELHMNGGTDSYTGDNGLAELIPSIIVDGGAGNDTLTGGDADETLSGGADVDTVTGGGGDDTFPVRTEDGATEPVDGGPGGDTLAVSGTDASEAFIVDAPGPGQASVSQAFVPGTLASGTAIERVRVDAGAGSDTVTPTAAAVSALSFDLSGGPGDDTLTGGQLPDTLRGGDGNDTLHGGDGNDQLFGDAGNDVLLGQSGADQFHCGGPTDTLDATAEDNVDADCVAPVVTPPGTTPPPDLTPPKLTIRSVPKRISRHVLLTRGIRVALSPNEAAALDVSLLGRARGAAVLAAAPNLTLVHRTFGLASGQRVMRLRPSKRLIGRSRHFTLTIQVVATDASRNRSTYTRTVRVR